MNIPDIKLNFDNYPKYLIANGKVYQIAVREIPYDSRAFSRDLKDIVVEGTNVLSEKDHWHTILGITFELYFDYTTFRTDVPLEYVMFRYLNHHLRVNSLDRLKGSGGEVLTTASFDSFLGEDVSEDDAIEIIVTVLKQWASSCPNLPIDFKTLFVSTDLRYDFLRSSINLLRARKVVEQLSGDMYKLLPALFEVSIRKMDTVSFDRRINRYFQEVNIEAEPPFCFVIMPFSENEFSQEIYTNVIKPLVVNHFKLSCYRVDEDYLPDRIDNKIYTYLLRSSFVIAELSTVNPNVLYELGIAHMLEKDCIMVTRSSIYDIPFDINKMRINRYQTDAELKEILKKSIQCMGFVYSA